MRHRADEPIGLPWGEVVIAAIGFVILLVVLGKFVWPMFEKSYAARTEAIEGGIAKAESAQKEAAAALEQYNQQLAGAREEAAKIREDARAQAQAIRDDMVAQAHAETERIAAAGRAQLDAQRSQVVAELRDDLGRTSVELAGKIVGESLARSGRAEPDGRAIPGRPGTLMSPAMQHIASQEALRASTEHLLEVAGPLDDVALRSLGSELQAVGELLDRELSLRRTLSESTTAADARASLLRRLLFSLPAPAASSAGPCSTGCSPPAARCGRSRDRTSRPRRWRRPAPSRCAATSSTPPRSSGAMAGCEVVYHVAGVNGFCLRDPGELDRANVIGTHNVVRAAGAGGCGGWSTRRPPR